MIILSESYSSTGQQMLSSVVVCHYSALLTVSSDSGWEDKPVTRSSGKSFDQIELN